MVISTQQPFLSVLRSLPWDALESRWNSGRLPPNLESSAGSLSVFASLLAERSSSELKAMADVAREITARRFGRVIQLYAPLYVSNECCNSCTYCGFRVGGGANRVTLTDEEVLAEAAALHATGFRHILLVSGEHKGKVPPARLAHLARAIKKDFPSVAVEIYPLEESGYRELVEAGVDSMTLYQETYNEELYPLYHPSGPKSDYAWRLAAMERAGAAGMARLNVGSLLGLAPWKRDAISTAAHALYLQKRFWRSVVAVSVPRMVHASQGIAPPFPVSDRELVQLVLAFRLVLPDSPIVVSTRESSRLRNLLATVAATTMSAGSRTDPGGYTRPEAQHQRQFEIEDCRSPQEVVVDLQHLGIDPVWKDWEGCIA